MHAVIRLLQSLQVSLWMTELCQDEEVLSKERAMGSWGGGVACRTFAGVVHPAPQNAAHMVTPYCTSHLFHQTVLSEGLPAHYKGGRTALLELHAPGDSNL